MSKSAIEGFTRLDAITSLYRPATALNSANANRSDGAPALIVICSWAGAASKHIVKYTDGHRRLFPSATILHVESGFSTMLFPPNMKVASDFVADHIKDDRSSSNNSQGTSVALHAFSNGGANSATQLAMRLKKDHDLLPFNSATFDCCPGRAESWSGADAVSHALPERYMMRRLGWYLLYVAFVLYGFTMGVLGREDAISKIRRLLNDVELFSQATPRLYMFSKRDSLVDWTDVHEHAEEAKWLGYPTVREMMFREAPHCALLNENASRYWGAVKAHVTGDAAHFK